MGKAGSWVCSSPVTKRRTKNCKTKFSRWSFPSWTLSLVYWLRTTMLLLLWSLPLSMLLASSSCMIISLEYHSNIIVGISLCLGLARQPQISGEDLLKYWTIAIRITSCYCCPLTTSWGWKVWGSILAGVGFILIYLNRETG